MTLGEYAQRAIPEVKATLQQQWQDATQNRTVVCSCGQLRALELAYRCLYCGVWFCAPCAEKHFGQTVQDWIEEKRIAARLEAQKRKT